MSKPVSEMTIAALKDELKEIERSCFHWKSSQDGSYEMALHSKGHHVLSIELRKRIKARR